MATGDEVGLFEQFGPDDVRALIEQYPLAWVCAGEGASFEASLLPLVGRYDAEGRLVELIGHLGKSNPLCAALAAARRATILFKGPDAYVSPEHVGRRDWAPTWNYAQLKIAADIRCDDALTDMALEVLIEAMEAQRADPWHAAELGPRYASMRKGIIGFRATVSEVSGRFKLGQDESGATLAAIVGNLPDAATVAWMRRFNGGRT